MTPEEEQEFGRLREENANLRLSLETLRQQLGEAINGNKELRRQLTDLQVKLDKLLHQLDKRNRREFGKKTERHNPRQSINTASQPSPSKKNQNHKKNILSQNLPDHNVHYTVDDDSVMCPTCNVATEAFSENISFQLERLRHSLVRLVHHQEVRSCPKCRTYIVTAPKPAPPFPECLAGPHLLASIIVNKLADGLPNFRQEKMFKREQGKIPRSTQCDWMIAASLTIEPLYDLMKKEVLQSKVVKTDDTWVKVQDRTRPDNIRKGKMTPYLGDKEHPLIVFDYSPTQSFDKNKEFLKDFTGYIQADAANGFDALFADGTRIELGCNAHARRKADEAKLVEPDNCEKILDIYSKLYKIEKDIKGKERAFRLEQRQKKSKPLTLKLHALLVSLQETLTPTNPLREYVDYTLRHWIALNKFLDDPDFEIDNNDCERTIKIFILMRKNSLFFGSDAGGKSAAIHLSFIASCERNNVDPLAYLTDVFSRINSMKTSELDQLLPDRWKPAPKPPP